MNRTVRPARSNVQRPFHAAPRVDRSAPFLSSARNAGLKRDGSAFDRILSDAEGQASFEQLVAQYRLGLMAGRFKRRREALKTDLPEPYLAVFEIAYVGLRDLPIGARSKVGLRQMEGVAPLADTAPNLHEGHDGWVR